MSASNFADVSPLRYLYEQACAREKVEDDADCWNRRLATLRREQEATLREMSPPKVPQVKVA